MAVLTRSVTLKNRYCLAVSRYSVEDVPPQVGALVVVDMFLVPGGRGAVRADDGRLIHAAAPDQQPVLRRELGRNVQRAPAGSAS